ncbi:MAG: hypothetical protein LBP53_04705 [Candidatus Peribacteria bacterium]|jgi:hypothetical protein|nr:hypothetical protein [Candidatus Peribacteria bacterium]
MQKKQIPFLITFVFLVGSYFFVNIQLGEGYTPKSQISRFEASAFFSALESFTGELFI